EWDLPRMLWQTSDGGYILGGESFSDISGEKTENSRGEQDGWLIKLDAAGNKVWDKTLGGSKGDGFGLFQLAVDGGYILGGWSSSDISGEKTENSRGGSDYWLVKLCDTPIKPTLGPDFAMACPGSEPDTLRTDEIAGLDYHWYRVSGPGSETPLAGDAHELEVLSPGTYIVEVENDCGLTERDTVVVSESAHPDASSLLPETAELCSGPVTLGPEVSITTYTFGWEDLGWGGISPRTFTEPGTYILRVIEFSAPDCPGYDTVVVSGGSAPTKPTLGPDRPWCRWTDQNANDPAYPPAASNPSLAGPVGSLLTYTWWRNGTELTSQTSRTLAITDPGTYVLEVGNGCNLTSRDTVTLTRYDEVQPFTLASQQEPQLCPGETQTWVGPSGSFAYTWEWARAPDFSQVIATTRQIALTQPGTYRLTAIDSCGNYYRDSVVITRQADPSTLSLTRPPLYDRCIQQGRPLQAPEAPGLSYRWTDEDGSLLSEEPVFLPPSGQGGTLTLEISDRCGRSATAQVEVIDPEASAVHRWGTAFSPNADGLHDTYPPASYLDGAYRLQVFNRWGQLVYTGSQPWRGTDGNTDAPEGTYVVHIQVPDCQGGTRELIRTLMLVR
ncbi:MAG: gliding motility-associated C-terminal domain-containing protein, partial [Sphingobacteriia bacterium]